MVYTLYISSDTTFHTGLTQGRKTMQDANWSNPNADTFTLAAEAGGDDMTNDFQFYANPYDMDATGFYFSTFEEYQTKAAANVNRYGAPVEEYEVEVIEAPDGLASMLQNAIHQGNIEATLETFEDLAAEPTYRLAALHYLMDVQSLSLEDALEKLDEVIIRPGTLQDAAYEYADELMDNYNTPKEIRNYFDYDAYARDCELGGDWYAFRYDGEDYVILNAND